MTKPIDLTPLPDKASPDYFRLLVRNCIETYKELPNDAMCLDYNKVQGKLRAMILDDEEYKKETRNIYARQRLEELQEIDYLASLAENDDNDDEYDPRSKGKKKQVSTADKDMLNMRFKAAQIKREIIASLNEGNNASERDAVAFMYVALTREELERDIFVEFNEGSSDDDTLDELTSRKEEVPDGSSGKTRKTGQTSTLDEDIFDVLENGEIVER